MTGFSFRAVFFLSIALLVLPRNASAEGERSDAKTLKEICEKIRDKRDARIRELEQQIKKLEEGNLALGEKVRERLRDWKSPLAQDNEKYKSVVAAIKQYVELSEHLEKVANGNKKESVRDELERIWTGDIRAQAREAGIDIAKALSEATNLKVQELSLFAKKGALTSSYRCVDGKCETLLQYDWKTGAISSLPQEDRGSPYSFYQYYGQDNVGWSYMESAELQRELAVLNTPLSDECQAALGVTPSVQPVFADNSANSVGPGTSHSGEEAKRTVSPVVNSTVAKVVVKLLDEDNTLIRSDGQSGRPRGDRFGVSG